MKYSATENSLHIQAASFSCASVPEEVGITEFHPGPWAWLRPVCSPAFLLLHGTHILCIQPLPENQPTDLHVLCHPRITEVPSTTLRTPRQGQLWAQHRASAVRWKERKQDKTPAFKEEVTREKRGRKQSDSLNGAALDGY